MEESGTTVFGDVYSTVSSVLDAYVTSTSASFIETLIPIATGMLLLMIILWGYAHWFGVVQDSLKESSLLFVKSAVIIGFALGTGLYQSVVVTTFMQSPEYFANEILYEGSGTSISGAEGATNAIDKMMYESGRIVAKIKEAAEDNGGSVFGVSYPDFMLMGLGWIMWILSLALGAIATFFLLATLIMLTLLLALGPIFILGLLFKSTQRYFELWLGMLVNMVLLAVLAIGIMSIIFGVVDHYVSHAANAEDNSFKVDDAISVAAVYVLSMLILSQVPQVASSLGGGVGLMMGDAVKKMAGGGAMSKLTGVKRSFSPGSKTFDAQGNLMSRGQGGAGYRATSLGARGAKSAAGYAKSGASATYRRFRPNNVNQG